MCPHLDKPVASWDILSPWGVISSWREPMCKSKPYPQSLEILEDCYPWTYYSPGSKSKLLCPLLPLYQIASETHLASVHQRIHSHWVSSYFTAGLGLARTGGTGQWVGRHCLFHLCSDLCLPSPLFHPSHRPPETTNIFHVTLLKNLALLCSCSKLSLLSTQDAA